MKGITEWKSAAGFHCIRLHYSADPAKDPSTPEGKKWLENELKGVPDGMASATFRREYEIDWDAAGGQLVFPQLGPYKDKIVIAPYTVPESYSFFASFDYGHRNPSSFHVYALDYDSNLTCIWEYYKSGEGYKEIAKAILACPYYEKLACAPIADPSIWALTQNTDNGVKALATLFSEIEEKRDGDGKLVEGPIIFTPGRKGGDVTVAEKIKSDYWADLANKEPRFKIFATCPMIIWELEKLRYAEWSGTMAALRNKREDIVDRENHSWDDLKYLLTQFFMGPEKPPVPKAYERLRDVDEISYREAKFRDELNSPRPQGTLGEW